jgi:hypothetical protein
LDQNHSFRSKNCNMLYPLLRTRLSDIPCSQKYQISVHTFQQVKQHNSYKRVENSHPNMEKLNQNNATIKKADKGQLHCYIKKTP